MEEPQEDVLKTDALEKEALEQSSTDATSNQPESMQAQIRELQQQLDEARSKQLYLLSDFENFKRHAARERIELMQTAGRDILAALVPVLDDFDRAAKNGGLPDGIALIQNKLVHLVQTKGLQRLDAQPGDAFDADKHEALAEVPMPDQAGKIVDVIEPGYLLGERILRFAKVVVGK